MSEAPTEPTEPKIEDGVEKIPVPITRPTLVDMSSDHRRITPENADLHEQCTAEDTEVAAEAAGSICLGVSGEGDG